MLLTGGRPLASLNIREGLSVAYAHFITLSPEQHQIRDSIQEVLTGIPSAATLKKQAEGTAALGVSDPAKLAQLQQYDADLEARRGPTPIPVQADPNKTVDSSDLLAAMDAMSGL